MEKIKGNNIIKAIIIAISFWIVYKIAGEIISSLFASKITADNAYFFQVLVYVIVLIYLFIILKLVKKDKILKEKGRGINYGIKVGRFMFIFSLIVLVSNFFTGMENEEANFSLSRTFWFILSYIGTGLTEEILCRGIIQNIICDQLGRKNRKSIIVGILLSSVIFGIMHFGNLFADVSLQGVIVQAIYATFIGFYFGAIYARTKNIYSVSILHALLDTSSLFDTGVFGVGSIVKNISDGSIATVLFSLVYLALGLYILRSAKADEFVENEQ